MTGLVVREAYANIIFLNMIYLMMQIVWNS